jgi:tetratricopeptide (TPR) repeat protein
MAAARDQRSNIQAAMDWMGVRGWHQERVEVLRNLRLFFSTIGHGEGLRQFEALLAHETALDPKLHVEVLVGAAGIYVQSGMHRKAEELLQLAERLSDELGVSWPLDMIHFRAMIAEMDGRPDDVVTQCTLLLDSPEVAADVFFDLLVRTRMVAGLIFARPDDALEFATDTLRMALDSHMDLFVAAAQLTLGLTHLVVTKDRSQAETCFTQTIELCADALPSASIPAHIGMALLALDDHPVEALWLMSVALTQEAAGVDEPVARACCYDVAAAACAEMQDLDSAERLLRQAERLRNRCGFGGLAWTLPGRQKALDILGTRSESRSTSPIDLTEETSGELIRLIDEVLDRAAAPNEAGAANGQ